MPSAVNSVDGRGSSLIVYASIAPKSLNGEASGVAHVEGTSALARFLRASAAVSSSYSPPAPSLRISDFSPPSVVAVPPTEKLSISLPELFCPRSLIPTAAEVVSLHAS